MKQRTGAATRHAVPYQCVTWNNISSAKRMFEYAKLAVSWTRIKVLIGHYAELSAAFIYKRSATMDPQ